MWGASRMHQLLMARSAVLKESALIRHADGAAAPYTSTGTPDGFNSSSTMMRLMWQSVAIASSATLRSSVPRSVIISEYITAFQSTLALIGTGYTSRTWQLHLLSGRLRNSGNGLPHRMLLLMSVSLLRPGTGKSKTIEKRVAQVLNTGATPQNVYVISFTVASSKELRERITAFCAAQPCAAAAAAIHVSTMHSLALRILRTANLLAVLYPHNPVVLDDWERRNIYDLELANALGRTPGRAAEIRLAHDAAWQTLNPQFINQAAITQPEIQGFNAFHPTRTNLYSCVLPGELVFRCVDAIRLGQIQQAQLPNVEHLIVDEFQDLNACDQEFVSQLAANGAVLFIAGDDDQSIYSFRHADPTGIVNFNVRYPHSTTHVLDECFRCTPNVLTPASAMVAVNPGRLAKNITSLYQNAAPPVVGRTLVWSFPTEQDEATAIAESCQRLINSGMGGREDEIVILVSDSGLQLGMIAQALGNLGLAYDPPRGEALTDDEGIRAVYCMLRVAKDLAAAQPDYVAHRALLALLTGVGMTTAKGIADACVGHHQNFHDLFRLPAPPQWLTARQSAAARSHYRHRKRSRWLADGGHLSEPWR